MNFFFLIALLFLNGSLFANTSLPKTVDAPFEEQISTNLPTSHDRQKPPQKAKMSNDHWKPFCFLEARGAYFLWTDSTVKSVYSPGALCGLEFDCRLYEQLYSWVGVDYLCKGGKTLPDHKSTTLTLVPISAGLKWIYTVYRAQPYLGAGIEAFYGKETIDSSVFAHSRANWGCGGIFKAGLLVYLIDHLFLDLYADYSLQKLNLKKLPASAPQLELVNSVNLSGFSFGLGLGYGF